MDGWMGGWTDRMTEHMHVHINNETVIKVDISSVLLLQLQKIPCPWRPTVLQNLFPNCFNSWSVLFD